MDHSESEADMPESSATRPETEHLDARRRDPQIDKWQRLRLTAGDIVHDVEMVVGHARAFETAVASAYATNAEMIAEPADLALDLTMLRRLHNYLSELVGFGTEDVAQADELLAALGADR
jgi:hypothetical protein